MVNAYNHNDDRMYLAGSSDNKSRSIAPKVGLFFYVEGRFAFSGCELSEAETYGDFLIFPESHFDVWNKHNYLQARNIKKKVDYDYYPRGRVVYRISDETFIIYYDKCVENDIHRLARVYKDWKVLFELDEHYCCHGCNTNYVE